MFWPILKEVLAPFGKAVKFNENIGLATLPNGVRIRLKGMDNEDRARGFILRHAVLDEYADMEPSAWDVVTAPSVMKTNGTVLFIGTPKRGRPHFADLLDNALNCPVDEHYGFPMWSGFQFASRTNPWLDTQAIKNLTKNMSLDKMREELEAEILSEGGNYLNSDWWKFDTREPSDGYFVVACDLGGFTSDQRNKKVKERRDDTALAIVKIHRGGWWVKEVVSGRWDTRETALRIIRAVRSCDAHRLGIESGTTYNAVWPYLQDMMLQFGHYRKPEALSHGNSKKEDRVMSALEGRLQRGRITLNCDQDLHITEKPAWVQKLIKQASDFPAPSTPDDCIDALSYADQLGRTVFHNYVPSKHDTWEPEDDLVGI